MAIIASICVLVCVNACITLQLPEVFHKNTTFHSVVNRTRKERKPTEFGGVFR